MVEPLLDERSDNMIPSFPKIFQVGTRYTQDILENEVEVTEKVDGSMFAFGMVDGKLHMRSKGKEIFADAPEKMFQEAVDYIVSIQDKLAPNTIYYAEYLKKPKHNSLSYKKIPTNHLVLYGEMRFPELKFVSSYIALRANAFAIGIDVVPLIYQGNISCLPDKIDEFLDRDSYLGGQKIEGIVIKNYNRDVLCGGQIMPVMMAKYVSETFKEVHIKQWPKQTHRDRFDLFKESYRTEARWNKSIQHLKEAGALTHEPQDIGKLIKEIQRDILEEEKENIQAFLWKEFSPDVMKIATRGFPEYYKKYLLTVEV